MKEMTGNICEHGAFIMAGMFCPRCDEVSTLTAQRDAIKAERDEALDTLDHYITELNLHGPFTCVGIVEHRKQVRGLEAQLATLTAQRGEALARAEKAEAYKPCEPCLEGRHDDCTGDCPSMCCALESVELERDSLERIVRVLVDVPAYLVYDNLDTQDATLLRSLITPEGGQK